ncbi:hypothetical protein A2U01_0097156, partial [Trifolium medium]|nr:hypothetical protein [Trifolium medium]
MPLFSLFKGFFFDSFFHPLRVQ